MKSKSLSILLVFCIALLSCSIANSKPDKKGKSIPKELKELLERGGWTPTPSNSARYQVGDVFDFSTRNIEELTKGEDCFTKLPKPQGMTNIEISRYLKGGLKIPLGLFKTKGKKVKYKRLTYANTEVQEFSKMQLDRNFKEDCKDYLRKEWRKSSNPSQIKLIKAVIQSTVNEQICTSIDATIDVKGLGVEVGKSDKCEFDAEAPVTIAYQLVHIKGLIGTSSGPKVKVDGLKGTDYGQLAEQAKKKGEVNEKKPVKKTPKEVSGKVEIKGVKGNDFASLAAQAKAAEEAERRAAEAEKKAAAELRKAQATRAEKLRKAKAALEKEIQRRLDKQQVKVQSKASQGWSKLKTLPHGSGKKARKAVEQFIREYSNVTVNLEGRSRRVNIRELGYARAWLTSDTEAVDAAKRRAEEERRRKAAAYEAKIQARLSAAEKKVQEKARSDWQSLAPLLKGGKKKVEKVVEQFIDSYGRVELKIEGRVKRAHIPEVDTARRWLSSRGRIGPTISGKGYEAWLIPSGVFTMGCTSEQGSDCLDEEKPAHQVKISRSFYMMKSEVTQGLYHKVMDQEPWVKGKEGCDGEFHCNKASFSDDQPAYYVSWYDAVKFANALSKKEGLEQCYQIGEYSEYSYIDSFKEVRGFYLKGSENTEVSWSKGVNCTGWRLPTESEWEYAARGGQIFKYAGSNYLGSVGWYYKNSGRKTHSVCGKKANGYKRANGYGLCDMSGNVWEWVWDGYGSYRSSSTTDPRGPSGKSSFRVRRGGGWNRSAGDARLSFRGRHWAGLRSDVLGFRVLRVAE